MKQSPLFAILVAALMCCTYVPASATDHYSYINYSDSSKAHAKSMSDMLSDVLSVTGLQTQFELRSANVKNIEAVISNRKRIIRYNPAFINYINEASSSNWCVVALLAHEVGHHLNGHTLKKGGSNPADELEADEFAGFVLNKLGATLEQSQEVMKYIATIQSSSTHPGRAARMAAIKKGWDKGVEPAK